MDMSGEYKVDAPREAVWRALNDPDVLKRAINGCETLERVGDDAFTAKVRAKVGPVSATFNGDVKITDADPPKSYTISGEGKGGAAGFAKGGADVALDEVEDGAATLLRYTARADVGGRLAQLGGRLIQGTARKMADDFFARFKGLVEEGMAPAAAAAPAVIVAPAPAASEPAPRKTPTADRKPEETRTSLPDDAPMPGGAATGAPRLPEEDETAPGQFGAPHEGHNVNATPGGLLGASATEAGGAAAIDEANAEVDSKESIADAVRDMGNRGAGHGAGHEADHGAPPRHEGGAKSYPVTPASAPSSGAGHTPRAAEPPASTPAATPLSFLGPGWVRWAIIALVVIVILALLF